MKLASPKKAAAVGLILVVALAASVFYALKLPPFEEVGKIEAGDVCKSLGDSSRAATSLKEVLPEESDYSFRDVENSIRTEGPGRSYETYCFVEGGGKQLVVAKAELMEYDVTDRWVEEVVEQLVPASSLSPFTAGDKAVASGSVAAIYVPCYSTGSDRHLSVVVQLKKGSGIGESERRAELVGMAENAAAYAHSRAKCDMPSAVDEQG
ncbi:hypothetical protein ABZX85_40965 [Streptomyces sp. NPDC004539]|uniref:hypothetical protein n=1 Tax=Streptomyces sp. NPDC004539 TaxID=3154280 RepID=UPI00339E0139